jgi:hypothetical protein
MIHVMRFIKVGVLINVFIALLFLPTSVFADTYGSGTYGGGAYGEQGSSSNSNPVSSAISAASNTISAFFCSTQAPSSAPNLYEIDVTSTTAKVFFSPAGGPYDQHFISYGQGNNSEGYGIDLNTSQTSGALFYVIEQLSPSTVYTFKVRGGNGCKAGPWSNTLTIQTLSSRSKAIKKFYPSSQAHYVQAPAANWWTQASNYVSSLLPGAPNTGLGAPKQHVSSISHGSSASGHTATSNSSSPSLWGNVANFFSGIFHAL